jgi:nickel superoxide dismutase
MPIAARILAALDHVSAPATVSAHCDIPCGVYDPEQARIEAESVFKIIGKYHDSDDEHFKARCIGIKEERTELAKHHISVLWSDYFKPEHLEQYPDIHDVCWKALKQCSTVKRSLDAADAQQLLDYIDQIEEFWKGTGGLESTRKSGRPS